MMDSNKEYLKYIFHEDLFIIDEPEPSKLKSGINLDNESVEPDQVVEEIHEPPMVKYLGSNNKGILILVNDIENEFINRHDLDFLMKIIESGLKYSKSDIGVVNCTKFPYSQIFDEVHHSYIIAFGAHKAEMFNGQPRYQLIDQDGIKLIVADDLSVIENDREKKMQLWKVLQRMFDLN
jgi:hypothetical protein